MLFRRWTLPFALVFRPAIAVMDRLTSGRKFILIALLTSGPLATLLSLQWSQASERIRASQLERAGVAFIAPLQDFLHALERHRLLDVAVRGGNLGLAAAREQAAAAADAAAVQVDQEDAELGAVLRTRGAWQAVRQSWASLRTHPDSGGAETDRLHGELGAQLLDLVAHRAGNYSNLILDPDLDSYWLMDAYVLKIPALQEKVSRSCAAALRVPATDEEAEERAVRLAAGQEGELALATELAEVDFRTAFRETAQYGHSSTLQGHLEGPLRRAVDAVTTHARRLREPPGNPAEPVTRALATLAQLDALFHAVGPELDLLVQARVDRAQGQRRTGLVAGGAVVLVLLYFFLAFYLSVRASMLALNRPSDPEGTQEDAFHAAPGDELGQVVVAFSRARDEKARLREQLRHADRLATIGQLAAGTAHELNEPLVAVLGFAELAQEGHGVPERTRADLDKIARAALHAREIIKKLLLFSRQTPPQKQDVQLDHVVQEALELLAPRCDQEDVALDARLHGALPQITADPGQVRQVVVNLVVNAVQATLAGGQVSVTTRLEEGAVVLVVEDRGSGMSAEVQKHLFLPFYTTKEIGQGTGLGLSVVHGIVTSHGGCIHVDSVPGRGTRFEVHLPRNAGRA